MQERVLNRKAFVSHSHRDHEQAKNLAEALRQCSVESWLDEWEIQPGDSLVQKVDQGLRDCGVFVVLLSSASVASAWVRDELDVALIQRIEGTARVIPVVVESCEIPTLLKPLLRLELASGVAIVAQKIADVIFGVRNVPPIAPPPSLLKFDVPGLTPLAARLAMHLFCAPEGPDWGAPPQFQGKHLVRDLSLSPEEINDAVDELESAGAVQARRPIGTMPFQFAVVWPTYRLALLLRGTSAIAYDPQEDIKAVANAVTSLKTANGQMLVDATGLSPNRINAAVYALEDRKIAQVIRTMGGGPFTFMQVDATSATRRFTAANT